MARIPQSFIDEIATADLLAIIGRRIELKAAGSEYTSRCPFHSEQSPSFTVAPVKGFYHCFGCGAHGNALGFVMRFDNVDFLTAVGQVAKELGREVPRDQQAVRAPTRSAVSPLYGLTEAAKSFYRAQLSDPSAIAYMASRGLSEGVVAKYELGYASSAWSGLKQGISASREAELLSIGLLARSNKPGGKVYDRFRERLMFPIRDERGRITGFGGRAVAAGTPKYLNSPESEIFKKSHVLYGLWQAIQGQRRLPRLLVVEGFLDVVAMAQFEAGPAVATMGTSLSETHSSLLFRFTDQVYFCFDGDRAGMAAAFNAARTVLPHLGGERQVGFVFLPPGEDPDSVLRRDGVEAFDTMLARSQPLSTFLFDQLQMGVDLGSIEGRSQLAERAFPVIDSIPAGAYHELMRRHLIQLTGLSGRPSGSQAQP